MIKDSSWLWYHGTISKTDSVERQQQIKKPLDLLKCLANREHWTSTKDNISLFVALINMSWAVDSMNRNKCICFGRGYFPNYRYFYGKYISRTSSVRPTRVKTCFSGYMLPVLKSRICAYSCCNISL